MVYASLMATTIPSSIRGSKPHIYAHIHTRTHTHIYAHIHTYTIYIHTHVYIYICQLCDNANSHIYLVHSDCAVIKFLFNLKLVL